MTHEERLRLIYRTFSHPRLLGSHMFGCRVIREAAMTWAGTPMGGCRSGAPSRGGHGYLVDRDDVVLLERREERAAWRD